jgi:hypothetical protein
LIIGIEEDSLKEVQKLKFNPPSRKVSADKSSKLRNEECFYGPRGRKTPKHLNTPKRAWGLSNPEAFKHPQAGLGAKQ